MELHTKLRKFALSLPGAVEDFPWGHPHYKVNGHIFMGLGPYKGVLQLGVKMTLPEQAIAITNAHFSVAPYVGKHGWVSVNLDLKPALPFAEIQRLIRHSHELISGGTRRKTRVTRPSASRGTGKTPRPAGKARPTGSRASATSSGKAPKTARTKRA